MTYMQKYPIPRVSTVHACVALLHLLLGNRLSSLVQSGAWDDVSGETFLRKLLSMPTEHAKWTTVS